MKKSSKRRWYKVTQAILTVIIFIAFAFAASVFTYLTICGVQDSNDQKEFDKIALTINESNKDDSSDETNGVYDLMLKNKDCVGWLKVTNTDIDYPVMLTKDEPEYYLRRNFNKSYSYMGTPFMDANCNIGISKNLIIYGHNMKNGRMFAPLMKFKNKECFDKHQIIEFVTPNEKAIYHIICVAKVKADDSWYSFIDDLGEDDYNEKIKELYSKSLYRSNYEFGYNDEFLTLSTCEYSQNDGRLILICVKS